MSTRQISPPKNFQQATVRAALKTLRGEGARRFLVADEVGLGKTVVARTVLQRLVEGKRKPLVVFYVASNLNIAHQNRNKLIEILPEGEQKSAVAKSDRLTLAANPAMRPRHERVHLYTLTPDTSAPQYRRRAGMGRLEERALIYRLLTTCFPSVAKPFFRDFCRGGGRSQKRWLEALKAQSQTRHERALRDEFLKAIRADASLLIEVDIPQSLLRIASQPVPSRALGRLRSALGLAVFRVLQPDLIIYDEFQKFRDLLIDRKEPSHDPLIASFRGEGPKPAAALLLLSATPFRLYSSRLDDADGFSHHHEFFELIRFLSDSESGPKKIESKLLEFGELMQKRGEAPDLARLGALRYEIQKLLAPILSRTERTHFEEGKRPAIHPKSEVRSEDIQLFKHWVERLRERTSQKPGRVDMTSFAVPFWLSVPLPIQMLGRNYMAWRKANRSNRRRNEPILRQKHRDRLRAPKIWPHPQFRELKKLVGPSRLVLPWVAPSVPWWDLNGAWNQPDAGGGKLLVFSRFKAVPQALASMLSYDLESSYAARLRHNYRRAGLAQPLQLQPKRVALLALFFPSPTLIAYTDPLRDKPASLIAARASMRRQVGALLRKLGVAIKRRGQSRPLWKLIGALEVQRCLMLGDDGLPSWEEMKRHWRRVGAGQKEIMTGVLNQWTVAAYDSVTSVSQREAATLAEFALAGPGVALGRALFRFDPSCVKSDRFSEILDLSWNGFRSYLNRSIFHAALTRRGQTYTKAVLSAVVDGNLESVIDEHLWVAGRLDADAVTRFPQHLKNVFTLREGRHLVHEPGGKPAQFQLRCHAAMPFGGAKVVDKSGADEGKLRTDELRRAFNTPFWPHVLVTTSLGQEGLDFHVWCRQLLHWDLCHSPLDLEQREGRIQRFGGLSVRTALANELGSDARKGATGSVWGSLANLAERKYDHDPSGLSPWWSCTNERIDNFFVVMPQSREIARFDRLSHQRWLYRLALGQPHQEDFIESVSSLAQDDRKQHVLCLSAWKNGVDKKSAPPS